MAEDRIGDGSALEKMRAWFEAQGATGDVIDEPDLLPSAAVMSTFSAPKSGWVSRLDAECFGFSVVRLGGGRKHKDDKIDLSVGIELNCQVGSQIKAGDRVCTIHARSDQAAMVAASALRSAIEISDAPVEPIPLIIDIL
jgi:thymidine phosphorylase